MLFAVCGLHMRGGKLNDDLTSRNATFVRQTKSAAKYTMHALFAENLPTKPAMIFHPSGAANAGAVTLEIWDIPDEAIGSLLRKVPAPLTFGTVHLEDGSSVYGFTAEGWAADQSAAAGMGLSTEDITQFGGWREWHAAREGR